jgi:glucose/arabinose dehydrogenase
MLPAGIAVDSSGNVYVADSLNQRIQKFTSSGSFLAQWGSFGNGVGQLDRPVGVAVDGSGNLYVTDSGNHRLLKFTADGSLLAQWGGYGSAAGEFALPNGVATDSDGNLYVADTGNQRIQQFGPVAAIAVTGNSIPLVNNDTTPAPSDDTDFGSVTSGGTPVVHTFTIGNNGASNLTLYNAALVTVNEGISVTTPSSVIVTISDSDAFTVTTQPTNTVAPNGTTNFAISFAPTTAGVYTATVRIASNDHNDPLFSFVVQ